MYPSGELNVLALRKAAVQARIAAHRWQCAAAAVELARPLAWIDRAHARWKSISPLAKMIGTPVAMLLGRKLFQKLGGGNLGMLARSAPAILEAVKMFAKARA
jgi:hypothetical protein